MVSIALLANVLVYQIFMAVGNTETFNMFYISPYFDCTLPILNTIYLKVPYIVFAGLYILGFSFVATVIYYVETGITKLVERIKADAKHKKQAH